MFTPSQRPAPTLGLRASAVALATLALLLAACGDRQDKGASQAAARVNKEEITVHQINFVLQQQRGIKPEQVEPASRQILSALRQASCAP